MITARLDFGLTVRNNALNNIEVSIGTLPRLDILSAPMPALITDPVTSVLLLRMALPSDWLSAASNGLKTKLGTWSGTGLATGDAFWWRILNSGLNITHARGTVGLPGSKHPLQLSSLAIQTAVARSVLSFSLAWP